MLLIFFKLVVVENYYFCNYFVKLRQGLVKTIAFTIGTPVVNKYLMIIFRLFEIKFSLVINVFVERIVF